MWHVSVKIDRKKKNKKEGTFYGIINLLKNVLYALSFSVRYDYYMRYKFSYPGFVDPHYWVKDKLLAKWAGAKIESLKTELSLCSVWIQMHKCNKSINARRGNNNPLGIKRSLKVSERFSGFNFVTVLKPLIDGIISSFHAHNGKDIDEIAKTHFSQCVLKEPDKGFRFLLCR